MIGKETHPWKEAGAIPSSKRERDGATVTKDVTPRRHGACWLRLVGISGLAPSRA